MLEASRPEPTDGDLIARSCTDPAAFVVLFERHFDVVYGYLARRVGPALAEELAAERPHLVVAVQRREARRGKVLVDWLQNDPTRSTVAPYSLRAAKRPLVSTPVTWDEVEGGELVFEADDVRARIDRLGDLLS